MADTALYPGVWLTLSRRFKPAEKLVLRNELREFSAASLAIQLNQYMSQHFGEFEAITVHYNKFTEINANRKYQEFVLAIHYPSVLETGLRRSGLGSLIFE